MEFSFICFINLKFLDRRKKNSFHWKHLLRRSLDSVARGGGTTRPTLDTPLAIWIFEEKSSADKNCMDDNVQDNVINGPRKEFESGSLSG